jgi:hypothetical protein
VIWVALKGFFEIQRAEKIKGTSRGLTFDAEDDERKKNFHGGP